MVVTRQTYGKYLLIHSVLFRASKLVREGEVRYEKWSGVMYTQVTPSWGRRGREKKKKKNFVKRGGKKSLARQSWTLCCCAARVRNGPPCRGSWWIIRRSQAEPWALSGWYPILTLINQYETSILNANEGGLFKGDPRRGGRGSSKLKMVLSFSLSPFFPKEDRNMVGYYLSYCYKEFWN